MEVMVDERGIRDFLEILKEAKKDIFKLQLLNLYRIKEEDFMILAEKDKNISSLEYNEGLRDWVSIIEKKEGRVSEL
jgi:hypothetical protein